MDRHFRAAQIGAVRAHQRETEASPEIINIVSAEQVASCCLRLHFDDDTEQVIDFKPFLSQAVHPDIRAWLQPEKFARSRLEYGQLGLGAGLNR